MTTVAADPVAVVKARRQQLGRKFEAYDVDVELQSAAFAWLESGDAPIQTNDFLASVGKRVFEGKTTSAAQIKGVLNWMSAEKKEKPKQFDLDVMPGRYAVELNGELRFYRVDRPDEGRWAGFTFVDQLVGSGGDFRRVRPSASERKQVAALIVEDPMGALQRFGQEVGKCSLCGSPLTDETSRTRGIGPDCWKNKVLA